LVSREDADKDDDAICDARARENVSDARARVPEAHPELEKHFFGTGCRSMSASVSASASPFFFLRRWTQGFGVWV
jgi:hypothetical protein